MSIENVIVVPIQESNILFAKQASGPKFAKVGAIFFSDNEGKIKTAYDNGNLPKYTFNQFEESCMLLYKNIHYTTVDGTYQEIDNKSKKPYYENFDNIFRISTSQGHYKIDLEKFNCDNLNENSTCDGLIIVGIPHKPILSDVNNKRILEEQNLYLIDVIYYSKDKLPLYTKEYTALSNHLKINLYMKDLTEDLENRYLTGFHLANDSTNNIRGI